MWFSLAAQAAQPGHDLGTVHGWTQDGAFVYEVLVKELYYRDEVPVDGEEGTVHHVVVQRGDAIELDWVVRVNVPDFAMNVPLVHEAAWTAWRDTHPLVPATKGRTGGAGVSLEVKLDPRAEGEPYPPRWDGDTCWVDTDQEQVTRGRLGLSPGSGFWSVVRREFPQPIWSASLAVPVTAFWTKAGDYVAIVVDTPTQDTMRGPVFTPLDVHVARATPLVAVLSPPSLGPALASEVAAALSGLGPIETGEAQDERPRSIVYTKAGYEEAAKAIASKVPGGATVEPMTWDGAQHVVVAVGDSAK